MPSTHRRTQDSLPTHNTKQQVEIATFHVPYLILRLSLLHARTRSPNAVHLSAGIHLAQ